MATHVVSTAVEQEFDTNQGLATGIATSGATGGQSLIVPLFAVLMASYSWRWGFAALGLATVVLMLFVARWFPRGIRRARETLDQTQHPKGPLSRDTRAIVRMPAFQILFWSYFICGYTTSGVIETHFPTLRVGSAVLARSRPRPPMACFRQSIWGA